MSIKKWIKITEFCEKYDVSICSVYTRKSTGDIPKDVFKKLNKKYNFIDEEYFTRREDFKRRVDKKISEYYYYLIRYFNEIEIGRMLYEIDNTQKVSTWSSFFSFGMFAYSEDSILCTKIPQKRWAFYRYSTWIIRAAMKERGVKMREFDIDKIYALDDKEMAE